MNFKVFDICKSFSRLSLLAIILMMTMTAAVQAEDKWWVLFTDKGAEANLDAIDSDLPERTRLRRQKAGYQTTSADLPVNESYTRAVVETGATIITSSRWLNGVSVIADALAIARINTLDCVESTQRVAWTERDGVEDADFMAGQGREPFESREYIPFSVYGESFRQADQAGVIDAHRAGFTGDGVLLGILDTGFQLDHEAFANLEVMAQHDFINGDADPFYDPFTDRSGQANHGTACLSVIAGYAPGQLVGIAPRVSVALAKTEETGSETRVEEDYWVAGIEWLEWLGVDVVSSSLSYNGWYARNDLDGLKPLTTRAAQRAVERGVVICNSAGNAGPEPLTIGAPADAPGVLAIAAVDKFGVITAFSSRGPSADGRIKPDVAAMGRKVACVQPMTFDQYTRWNGTSLACPIVTGVVALMIEAHPDWRPEQVIEALTMTADRSCRPDTAYGYGIVDAMEAICYPSVKGRVVAGESIEELSDITIVLTNGDYSERTTVSDQGYYRFNNVPTGALRLEVWRNGELIAQRVDLVAPPSLEVDLVVD